MADSTQATTRLRDSNILRGVLIIFVTQLVAHLKLATFFHSTVLNETMRSMLTNVTPDQISDIVHALLDTLSTYGGWMIVHSRIFKPVLPIKGSKLGDAVETAIAGVQLPPAPVIIQTPVPVMVKENNTVSIIDKSKESTK